MLRYKAHHTGNDATVERVTRPRIDADPRVVEATAQQQAAAKAVRKALEPDDLPRLRMHARIFGAAHAMAGRPWTGDRSTSVLVDSELIGA